MCTMIFKAAKSLVPANGEEFAGRMSRRLQTRHWTVQQRGDYVTKEGASTDPGNAAAEEYWKDFSV